MRQIQITTIPESIYIVHGIRHMLKIRTEINLGSWSLERNRHNSNTMILSWSGHVDTIYVHALIKHIGGDMVEKIEDMSNLSLTPREKEFLIEELEYNPRAERILEMLERQ